MEGDRRSRILGGMSADARNVTIALVSTVVFFTVLVLVITNSPGWPEVKTAFFNPTVFREAFPEVLRAFWLNIKIFCVAEVFILAFALVIAVLRSLPGPVFFPIRALAIVYTDFFRGIPTILLIFILGFGVPALGLSGVPTSALVWATVALIIIYSAYVAEVYRAGIESVHPSQDAAARSLGLTRAQSLRYVVVPQAVRRVVPPLLNDFIGLQKDTALVALIGPVEAFRQAQIDTSATFNFTPYVAAALIFVAFTIPLARLTDWLNERSRRRRLAAGIAPVNASLLPRPAGRAQVVRQARGAEGHRPLRRRARGRLPHRRLRLGEVHAPSLHQPDRADRRGQDLHPGRGDHAPRARRQPGPARDRDRLSVLQPLPAHDRARERDPGAAQGARPRPRAGRRARASSYCGASGSRTGAATIRTAFRAASSSALRSCARWRCSRSSCFSTRSRARSTRSSSRRC